jgi:FAD/FMN-containing dehydrogenase
MAAGVLWFRIHPSKAETMNRRSFLLQGLCSSLPFLARSSFSQQVAGLPAVKPSDADLTALARGLTGNIFRSGDPKYEQLRKGYAAKFDEHPAFVVRPVNPQDIQAVLSFARSNHLPLAVRCGGHNYAGYSTCEGGIVLEMSGFRASESVLNFS